MIQKTAVFALTALLSQSAHAGLTEVLARFQTENSGSCQEIPPGDAWDRMTSTVVSDLGGGAKLYAIVCNTAAYNISYVNYIETTAEIRKLRFAEPRVSEKTYKVLGMYVTDTLFNLSYDSATKTLAAFVKGRGIGDAFESSQYKYDGEGFELVKYVADFSFDGKVKPRVVFDVTKNK